MTDCRIESCAVSVVSEISLLKSDCIKLSVSMACVASNDCDSMYLLRS